MKIDWFFCTRILWKVDNITLHFFSSNNLMSGNSILVVCNKLCPHKSWLLSTFYVQCLKVLISQLKRLDVIFSGLLYEISQKCFWNLNKIEYLKSHPNERIFSSPSGKRDTDFFRSCLIFVGSSPTWGDIFFLKWTFSYILIYHNVM